MTWIQTYTGKRFDVINPRAEDVDVRDIAHALAHTCRFSGHVRAHYSVAQHCVLASQLANPEARLLALLHDAAEAYLGDVAAPYKGRLMVRRDDGRLASFREIEDDVLLRVLMAVGVPLPLDRGVLAEVKRVDRALCQAESRALLPGGQVEPEAWAAQVGTHVADVDIMPWKPIYAERMWLVRLEVLAPNGPARDAAEQHNRGVAA